MFRFEKIPILKASALFLMSQGVEGVLLEVEADPEAGRLDANSACSSDNLEVNNEDKRGIDMIFHN